MLSLAQRELRRQVAIRGWDQRTLARTAGVSEATISRPMPGHRARRGTVLLLIQALRRQPPIEELIKLVSTVDDGSE